MNFKTYFLVKSKCEIILYCVWTLTTVENAWNKFAESSMHFFNKLELLPIYTHTKAKYFIFL